MSTTIQAENEGKLFTRLYLDRGAPVQDNPLFRNRINAYLEANHYKDYSDISSYLKQEGGLVIKTTYLQSMNSVYYDFSDFFTNASIESVLNSITLIKFFLAKKYAEFVKYENSKNIFKYEKADA